MRVLWSTCAVDMHGNHLRHDDNTANLGSNLITDCGILTKSGISIFTSLGNYVQCDNSFVKMKVIQMYRK